MLHKTAGIQTHIWNNNLKSLILLALYPVLIGAIIWLCTFVAGAFGAAPSSNYAISSSGGSLEPALLFANSIVVNYWPMILTGVVIWFTVAFFFHTKMVRKLSHSHPVTRKEEPQLYNMLENLCIAKGMPMPRLEIIETHARNAFASGINEKSFTVTLTRGLINALQKDEVEAVIAHELGHILNRDVRLLIITIIFTGMMGFAAQMAWSNIRYSFINTGQRRKNGGGALILIAIAVILWLGYLATLLTRFAISRKREFMADAASVEMTKNPDAMMRALMRISGRANIPETTDDIAMMCIENAKPFLGLFKTHPPIEKRIQAISQYSDVPIPQISSHTRTDGAPVSSQNQKNPWLIRTRGHRSIK